MKFDFYITTSIVCIIVCSSKQIPFSTHITNNLWLPQWNLIVHRKGIYFWGIRIFTNLHLEIKNVAGNQKKLKIALKQFSYNYLFCCRLHPSFRWLGVGRQSRWRHTEPSRPRWRICVNMEPLWQQQDGGYMFSTSSTVQS